MKRDDIKTLIIVIVVCSFFIGLILILNHKSNSDKLEPVSEYNTFFSIYNYANDYVNTIANHNDEKIYNLIYSDYILDNNITTNNISDYIENIEEDISLKVKEIDSVEIKDNYLYYVKGDLIKQLYNSSDIYDSNYEIIVLVDYKTLAYSVYPVLNNNATKIINSIKKIAVEPNTNNKIKGITSISKERICSLYLSDYINYIYQDIDKAYSMISDEKKKEEEFSTLNNFKKYIDDNSDKITSVSDRCLLTEKKNKRIYSVIDKNGNKYDFTENNILNYKVDMYINYIENYDSLDTNNS